MDKINKFDLSKYNLHGEELLASAAVAGLYAMKADGADCPQCDFGSFVEGIEGRQVTINAPAAKEIIGTAMAELGSILESWNPESPMMVGMKTTLQSANIVPDRLVQNMSTGFAEFLADISAMAKEG